MKEIVSTKYVCDYCKKEFESEDECARHEANHSLKEKLDLVKGSIICPTCNGNGWYYGNDGCDCSNCYTCNGKGIVIPKTKVTTEYKPL